MDLNPYAYRYEATHFAKELNEKYSKLKTAQETKDKVVVTGRIMLLRDMGKVTFMHLQDETGKVQLFFRKDSIGDYYDLVKKLDLGDIIGVKGFMFKTKKGEVTIHVKSVEILTKALLPPPAKHHGLKDTELRYRKRYLDLMMNPEVREVFRKRAQIISAFREYLDGEGFVEVDTPILQTLYGGATAKPFITKHNTLKMDMYLRISDEMYLKRLLVGGFDKVYEICKDFRNEGIDTSHNPEFTLLEWQEAYQDYIKAMERFEECVAFVVKKVTGSYKVKFQGTTLDFKTPWKRITMRDALKKHAKIDVDKMSDKELKDFAKKNRINLKSDSRGLIIATIFEETCEEFFIQPTILMDFPHATSPLAKQLRNGDKDFVERFEPYVMRMEIGNNYSELNDPVIQRDYFEESAKDKEAGHPVDEDYIKALEHGMPPSGGVGIGVDRIVMLLTDSPSIRDVILFPTLRNKE